jgi:hypothetical protein
LLQIKELWRRSPRRNWGGFGSANQNKPAITSKSLPRKSFPPNQYSHLARSLHTAVDKANAGAGNALIGSGQRRPRSDGRLRF